MYECNSVFKMSSTHRLHLYNLKMHRKSSSRHYYINIAIRSLHEGLVGKLMSVYVDLTWRRNLTEKEQQKHFLHLALIKKTSWPTDELQTRARSAFSGEWLETWQLTDSWSLIQPPAHWGERMREQAYVLKMGIYCHGFTEKFSLFSNGIYFLAFRTWIWHKQVIFVFHNIKVSKVQTPIYR